MAITSELIRLFRERFVQRADLYPIQLDRGGYTVVRRPLTDETIRKHLEGELTLGLYSAGRLHHQVAMSGPGHEGREGDTIAVETPRQSPHTSPDRVLGS